MCNITSDMEKRAETVAEHCAITAMMQVPAGEDPADFVTLVIENMRAKCDEKVKEVTRRASLQRQ